MSMYDDLAPFYDALNGAVDYQEMAAFLDKLFKRFYPDGVKDVLDLGCGTGNVTIPLASLGYGMVGVDISEEMLSEARSRDESGKILWLLQDMRAFELYGTVEATVCTLDGINHLTCKKGVEKCFSLVHNYLVPNGVFIFDVNSPYKFECVYGDKDYILETEDALCAWQNSYSPKTHICRFDISLFTQNEDGTYTRTDSFTKERMYSLKDIKELLEKTGFSFLAAYDGYQDCPPNEKSERITIVAKANKPMA